MVGSYELTESDSPMIWNNNQEKSLIFEDYFGSKQWLDIKEPYPKPEDQ